MNELTDRGGWDELPHRHWIVSNHSASKATSVRPVYDICCGGPDRTVQINLETFAISSVRFPCFHAVLKHSKEKITFIVRVAWRDSTLVTGNSCGGGHWRHPGQHGLGPNFGRIGSIVRLGFADIKEHTLVLSFHWFECSRSCCFSVQSNLWSVYPPELWLALRGLARPWLIELN